MNIFTHGLAIEAECSPPIRPKSPLVVLSHPHPRMGGDMHNKVIDQLFRRGGEKGWGVTRFNFRGVGQSTGTYDSGNGEVDDLAGILKWSSEQFRAPIESFILVGYSFGSWISSKLAASLPEIKKLVLIAPPIGVMDFSMLAGVRHPKNVFAAERDEVVAIEITEDWFTKLEPPKTLTVIPGADHFFVGKTTELLRHLFRTIESD